MNRHLRIASLAVATLATVALTACRPNAEPTAAPVVEVPSYEGDLVTLLPDAVPTYVLLDLAAIRADGRFGEFVAPAESEAVFHQATANADELLIGWTDALLTARINLMRTDMDREALFSELRTSDNFAGGAFAFEPVGPHKVWYRPEGTWAIAAPASNVVMTGGITAVEELVTYYREVEPTPRTSTPAVRVHSDVTRVHHQLLQATIGGGELVRRLGVIDAVDLEASLGLGADVTLRLGLADGSDPTELLTLFAALYFELDSDGTAPVVRLLMQRARLDVDVDTGDVLVFVELSRDDVSAVLGALDGTTDLAHLFDDSIEPSPTEPDEPEGSGQLPQ